jgi:hypothetical protein
MGRLLLIERVSWMNPNLRRSVAIFRIVRNSGEVGAVAKKVRARRDEAAAYGGSCRLTRRKFVVDAHILRAFRGSPLG